MTLNDLAVAAPDWLRETVPEAWFGRYGRRIEEYRLPRGKTARHAYAVQVGEDGFFLLDVLERQDGDGAAEVHEHESVRILQQVWAMHFERKQGQVRWREGKDPPSAGQIRIQSPFDPEAEYSRKRTRSWVGYRVHLSESCDEDTPHLITHVQTTSANLQDMKSIAHIHRQLEEKGLLPETHLVDSGYVDAEQLLESRQAFGIQLHGPASYDHHWQAKQADAYDLSRFTIDWQAKRAICPNGKRPTTWSERNRTGKPAVQVREPIESR